MRRQRAEGRRQKAEDRRERKVLNIFQLVNYFSIVALGYLPPVKVTL
ncbi:hypothetical protein [[Phormidium ambiguum] IAM M-71]|nr:hypothetical protein [Phormidium ambiguum]